MKYGWFTYLCLVFELSWCDLGSLYFIPSFLSLFPISPILKCQELAQPHEPGPHADPVYCSCGTYVGPTYSSSGAHVGPTYFLGGTHKLFTFRWGPCGTHVLFNWIPRTLFGGTHSSIEWVSLSLKKYSFHYFKI